MVMNPSAAVESVKHRTGGRVINNIPLELARRRLVRKGILPPSRLDVPRQELRASRAMLERLIRR